MMGDLRSITDPSIFYQSHTARTRLSTALFFHLQSLPSTNNLFELRRQQEESIIDQRLPPVGRDWISDGRENGRRDTKLAVTNSREGFMGWQ